jgi:hypothetical protein
LCRQKAIQKSISKPDRPAYLKTSAASEVVNNIAINKGRFRANYEFGLAGKSCLSVEREQTAGVASLASSMNPTQNYRLS